MVTGTAKWFDSAKGCGLASHEDEPNGRRVHASDVGSAGSTTLRGGRTAERELAGGRGGRYSARNMGLFA